MLKRMIKFYNNRIELHDSIKAIMRRAKLLDVNIEKYTSKINLACTRVWQGEKLSDKASDDLKVNSKLLKQYYKEYSDLKDLYEDKAKEFKRSLWLLRIVHKVVTLLIYVGVLKHI